MKLAVFVRDRYTCVCCGFRPKKAEMKWQICSGEKRVERYLTLDHIIPVSKGGPHTMDNLQTMCNVCNGLKGDSYI